MFSMMFLGCAILGSVSSILVFIGLRKDQREFLVPWILVMSADILVAILHFFSVVVSGEIKFEPLTGTLFTIDFFITFLNVRRQSEKFSSFPLIIDSNLTDVLSCLYRVSISRVQTWSWLDGKSLYHCEFQFYLMKIICNIINPNKSCS